jgi:hypothetical protein
MHYYYDLTLESGGLKPRAVGEKCECPRGERGRALRSDGGREGEMLSCSV